ncbi:MAG: FHA domain-containing protein [Peptococcaceae bacterium]|jgi:pSer/pThr/pTyr-binding forkhead associated (FHA) protein|nr:FHA domain-containing protein [Peptococcaceae bacterium]
MQVVLLLGRLAFIALIYLFLFRMTLVLYAELQTPGMIDKKETEYGCIEVLAGNDTFPKGRVFKVGRRGLSVGRSQRNDIVLPDRYASLEHAVFKSHKGALVLEDCGSTNGTWVNGERISSPIQLAAGDYVKIGGITFQYSR